MFFYRKGLVGLLRIGDFGQKLRLAPVRHSALFVEEVQDAVRPVFDQFYDRLVIYERDMNERNVFGFVELFSFFKYIFAF